MKMIKSLHKHIEDPVVPDFQSNKEAKSRHATMQNFFHLSAWWLHLKYKKKISKDKSKEKIFFWRN